MKIEPVMVEEGAELVHAQTAPGCLSVQPFGNVGVKPEENNNSDNNNAVSTNYAGEAAAKADPLVAETRSDNVDETDGSTSPREGAADNQEDSVQISEPTHNAELERITETVGRIKNAQDNEQARSALLVLLTLSRGGDPQCYLNVIHAGFLPVAVRIIRKFEEDKGLVLCVYHILANLAEVDNSGQAVTAIIQAGTIQAIIHRMQRRMDDEGILGDSCGVLSHIAFLVRKQKLAYNERGLAEVEQVKLIVGSMMKYPFSARIQQYGCAALSNLTCSRDSRGTAEELVKQEGIKVVVCALKRYANLPEIQVGACSLLRNISRYSERNAGLITWAGGTTQIVKVIDKYGDNIRVLECACDALQAIASNSDARTKSALVRVGAVATLERTMQAHIDNPKLYRRAELALDRILKTDDDSDAAAQVSTLSLLRY